MKKYLFLTCIAMVSCLLMTSCSLFSHHNQTAAPSFSPNQTSDSISGTAAVSSKAKQSAKNKSVPIVFTDGISATFHRKDLSHKYKLQKEENGTYTIRNRITGNLLSITLSDPKMPAQVEQLLAEVQSVYQIAHNESYTYGDSKTLPPCEDHLISCDRLIARALWNLGYTDQQPGGMTIGNEDTYLTSHGFRKLKDTETLQRGDILLYERTSNGSVSHTCILTGYHKATGICSRYDCGGTPDNPRFARIEPIIDPVVYQYDYKKRIRAAYRMNTVNGDHDSILTLKDQDDTNEMSQRWILRYSMDDTYLFSPAIADQYYISEEGNALTISSLSHNGILLKLGTIPQSEFTD